MLKSFLAVAANRVIVDARSNQISIIDVFEGLKSQSFPIVIPSLTFLFYIHREPSDPKENILSIKCLINDEEIVKSPVTVNFYDHGTTTRAIIGVDGFLVPRTGILKIILLDGSDSVLNQLELPIEQLEISTKPIIPTVTSA